MASVKDFIQHKSKHTEKALEKFADEAKDLTPPKGPDLLVVPVEDKKHIDKFESIPVPNDIDIDEMDESDFEEYLQQTKRSILQMLRSYVDELKLKIATEGYKGSMQEFLKVQKIFDSIYKQEIARESMLIKKRKENEADDMAVFDIYGRYGDVDEATINSMRQALYGDDNAGKSKPDNSEAVAISEAQNTGTSVPADGASEEGA